MLFLIFIRVDIGPRKKSGSLSSWGIHALVPFIKRAFSIKDPIWHYWILDCVIDLWDRNLLLMLSSELLELALRFDC